MLFKLVTTGQKNDDEKSILKVRPKEEKAVGAAPGRGLGTFFFSISICLFVLSTPMS